VHVAVGVDEDEDGEVEERGKGVVVIVGAFRVVDIVVVVVSVELGSKDSEVVVTADVVHESRKRCGRCSILILYPSASRNPLHHQRAPCTLAMISRVSAHLGLHRIELSGPLTRR